MKKYILGFFKYLFYLRVSKLALVDSVSKVSPDASVFRGGKTFQLIYRSNVVRGGI